MTYQCSFCSKSFRNLQQLGGHQTCHREEMKALRTEYEETMNNKHAKNRPELKMVLLRPNVAFWEMYHKYGIEPKVMEFLPEANKIVDPVKPAHNVEYHEVTFSEVDLTFKL